MNPATVLALAEGKSVGAKVTTRDVADLFSGDPRLNARFQPPRTFVLSESTVMWICLAGESARGSRWACVTVLFLRWVVFCVRGGWWVLNELCRRMAIGS